MDVIGIDILDTSTKTKIQQAGTVQYHNDKSYLWTIPQRVAGSKERERVEDPVNSYGCHYFLPLSDTVVAIVELDFRKQLIRRAEDEQKIKTLWRQLTEAFRAGAFQTKSKQSPELEAIFKDPFRDRAVREVQKKVDELKAELTRSTDAVLRRGESLDRLLESSTDLEKSALQFRRQTKKITPARTWAETIATVGLFSASFVTGTVGATALLMGKITGLYIACCAGGYAVCFLMIAYGLYKLIKENATPQNTMTTALRTSFR